MATRYFVILFALVGLFTESNASADAPKYHYYYYDELQPLTLDVSKVAVFEHQGSIAAVATNALSRQGIAASAIERSQVPRLSIAGTTATVQNDATVQAMVQALAGDQNLAFVSPVFLDSRNLPLMFMEHLHVGFHDNIGRAEAEAILIAEDAGEILERDWANMANVYRLKSGTRNGFELLAIANKLAQRAEVHFAEPELLMTGQIVDVIPNDPGFPTEWGVHNTGQSGGTVDVDMNGPEAWDITQGDTGIITVIMDTGCQQDHPDINQIPGNDLTGQGTNGGPGNICDGHGTTTSGTVSAMINNALGTVGIAPQSKTASARVFISNVPCSGFGSVSSTWIVNALSWAESIGARVTNTSLSIGASATLNNKWTSTRINGMMHFASAGNGGFGSISYPASHGSVEGISAVTRTGSLASFSQFGAGLAFAAPGVSIHTADETGSDGFGPGDTVTVDGTSYASPYAAGVAALVFSLDPTLWPSGVRQILSESAKDLGAVGYDALFGWGLVDAHAALLTAAGPVQRCEVDTLEGVSPSANDLFGDSVAVSGDFVVAGVSGDDDLSLGAGSAQFFEWDGSNFVFSETVFGSDSVAGDGFGDSAAMSGDVAVVGAPKRAGNSGAIYVFRWNGSNWAPEQKLVGSDSVAGDFFGDAVAISGGVIVAGARTRECASLLNNCGAAYVFRYNGLTWDEDQILTASDAAAGDLFGGAVSVSGDLIAVGASSADCSGGISNCGVGYVYRYDGAVWNEEDILLAADPANSDVMGSSIAIEGDTVLTGARGDDCPDGLVNCGSVYGFQHNAGTWAEFQKITSAHSTENSDFGASVAMSGDFAIIGSPGSRCSPTMTNCGTAFAYQFNGATWEMNTKLLPPVLAASDQFGSRVAIAGGVGVVGASFVDCGAGGNCGEAYVFGMSGDCNGNSFDDFCDIRDGVSPDLDSNGEPDECVCQLASAPVAELIGADVSTKNRHLSFAAGTPGSLQAIRVTVVDLPVPFNALNGTEMWVGAPTLVSELPGVSDASAPTFNAALLECDPVFIDWTTVGTIHVAHEIIVPGGDFLIEVLDETCDETQAGSYSTPLELSTSRWGDVVRDCSTNPCSAPDGIVSIPTDLVSILDKFSGLPGAPIKARCDLEPATPNNIINVQDTSRAIAAFQGLPYPFTVPASRPCP